jgi:methyltransferase (TIGR00027 family)
MSLQPQWDPITRIGAEEMSASAFRAFATLVHPDTVSDRFAVDFVEEADSAVLQRLAHAAPDVAVDDPRQWLTDGAFVAARTRYFDDFARAAGLAGIGQIVLLGAGLHTRAHRLDWADGTTVFDIDEPAVIAVKTAVLQRVNADTAAAYQPVGADVMAGWGGVRTGWPVALQRAGFDPSRPTAWVVESVLSRLSTGGQQRLMRAVAALSGARSMLAVDYLDVPDVTLALMDDIAGVRTWRSLDMMADVADVPPTGSGPAVPRLLRRLGWTLTTTSSVEVLHRYGLPQYGSAEALSNHMRFIAAAR